MPIIKRTTKTSYPFGEGDVERQPLVRSSSTALAVATASATATTPSPMRKTEVRGLNCHIALSDGMACRDFADLLRL
jgi:hypothetical protein